MKTYSWNKYTEGDAVRLNVETRLWTAAVTHRKLSDGNYGLFVVL